MVCYEPRKLNEHKKNNVTHDLELLAIIHSLKMWRHYLFKRFSLMIDHSGMRHLFDQPNPNVKNHIWLATLSELYFEIR